MAGGGFVDVILTRAFGGEIAAPGETEIERGGAFRLGKAVGAVGGGGLDAGVKFAAREVERGCFQRAVGRGRFGRGFGAGGVVIGDVGEAFLCGGRRAVVDQHQVSGRDVVEQGDEAVLQQGQPMFHAGKAPPVADRLIQRIGGGGGAESLAVARAEAFDGVLVQQSLAGGQQQMFVGGAGGALRAGIEQPQGLDFIAEEIEAQARV